MRGAARWGGVLVCLGAAGCGGARGDAPADAGAGSRPAKTVSTHAPANPPDNAQRMSGQQITATAAFGRLIWRCDTSAEPVRYSASLQLPMKSAELFGTVRYGGRKRSFDVKPGRVFATPFTAGSRMSWRIVFNHLPRKSVMIVRLRFDYDADEYSCILRKARIVQTAPQ